MDVKRLKEFSTRLSYGLPLSVTEQRELMAAYVDLAIDAIGWCSDRNQIVELGELAKAAFVQVRKRCEVCGGEGQVRTGGCAIYCCDACQGSGYQEAPECTS